MRESTRSTPTIATATVEPLARALLDSIRDPAILLSSDYRIQAANERYRSAFGTDVDGRYCYEVSHRYSTPCHLAGESCPLLEARESGRACRCVHLHHTPRGPEHEDVVVHPLDVEESEERLFLERIRPITVVSPQRRPNELLGRSPAFNFMIELIQKVAPRETAVLLLGESGTGKELVAHAVHEQSACASGAFVPVDCSSMNESLFESELFGHERGAFTGAIKRRDGLVREATGGTLFLDEVGDVPLALQVKLLRLLETRQFRRVGSNAHEQADFRLICATHRDLEEMVRTGAFREDLYYRLSAFPIRVPPLRERIEDIQLLVEALLERVNGHGRVGLSEKALECLRCYRYPGNVRELLNILERASLLAEEGLIEPRHLAVDCEGASHPMSQRPDMLVTLEKAEDHYLSWARMNFDGSLRELAKRLGISERTLYRRLERLRDTAC